MPIDPQKRKGANSVGSEQTALEAAICSASSLFIAVLRVDP